MGQTIQNRLWTVWLLGGLLALFAVGCEEMVDPGAPLDPAPPTDPMPPSAAIEAVSVTARGYTGDHFSADPVVSADGRFVAFESFAADLVPGDTNATLDVFVHDRFTGKTTRVSVDSDGNQGNDQSKWPAISADGRFVAFQSWAGNLVPGDTNDVWDVFVHDRETGETTRVSVDSFGNQADSHSFTPSISANGRFVAFASPAGNLVTGDTTGRMDVFVHDRLTGETNRVFVDPDDNHGWAVAGHRPSISADGRYVAFHTENRPASGLPSVWKAVFVRDLLTGETTRVSVDSNGIEADGESALPSISADGRFVSFFSYATNLVPEITSSYFRGIYVHDVLTGETTLASVDSNGIAASGIYKPSISADGRFVTFSSTSSGLVPEDTNGTFDIFVHDRESGETVRLSLADDGTEGNGRSVYPAISADGRVVAFHSQASNLVDVDVNGAYDDAFVTANTASPFDPFADDDGDGLTNQQELLETFTHYFKADSDEDGVDDRTEVENGTDPLDPFDPARPVPPPEMIEAVSITPNGITGNGGATFPSTSGDGRFVAFESYADNLVPGDTNNVRDVFVRDRLTGETTRVSVDSAGNEAIGGAYPSQGSGLPSISADGRFVAFSSYAANLVPGDTNGNYDVFVHDRLTGETTRVNVDSSGNESAGINYYVTYPRSVTISADGRFVAFFAYADDLVPGDTNRAQDIFVHDRLTGETVRASVSSTGGQGNLACFNPVLSADGRYVTFDSIAGNLVDGDYSSSGTWDIFVHDLLTGETIRANEGPDGAQPHKRSIARSISADGRFTVFHSTATNLVAGDTNGTKDVFVHDRDTGEITRVSVDSSGNEGLGHSYDPWISADGRFVVFSSLATNLVPGDTNDRSDIFVHDRATGTTVRVSEDIDGTGGNGPSSWPHISADGRTVTFSSISDNLSTADTNGTAEDVFIAPNPLSTFDPMADDDGDGLTNNQELLETFTHYFKADSDEDGVDDGVEVTNGTDPLDPASF